MTAPAIHEHARAIGERLDRSPLCVMLDVDGTLAPIVATPELASVPPETREVIVRLTRLPDTSVVLVSGRAAADAWRVASVQGVWVIGNHGFEVREPSGTTASDERVSGYDAAIARAAERLYGDLQGVKGAIVENKRWTLSVHYRMVDERAVSELRERAAGVAHELGLRVMEGKKIVELRPPVDVNKGTACVAFTQRIGITPALGSVLYAGDDRTDEDAFRELRATLPGSVTVRVAAADEARSASHAEVVLGTLPELRDLLQWLADRRESARRH